MNFELASTSKGGTGTFQADGQKESEVTEPPKPTFIALLTLCVTVGMSRHRQPQRIAKLPLKEKPQPKPIKELTKEDVVGTWEHVDWGKEWTKVYREEAKVKIDLDGLIEKKVDVERGGKR